jgi:hypothetical protein
MSVDAGVADSVREAGAFGSDDEPPPPPPPHPTTVMTTRDMNRPNRFLRFIAASLSVTAGSDIETKSANAIDAANVGDCLLIQMSLTSQR